MIMIMISYNVLQKRLISQKYKKEFSRKIRLVAIPSHFYCWISIMFVMNSAVAVSLAIYLTVLFIFCIIILSLVFVTWPVILPRITMFINKSVEYILLFSIDGISLGRLIIRVRGGLAIQQSGLTDN